MDRTQRPKAFEPSFAVVKPNVLLVAAIVGMALVLAALAIAAVVFGGR